YEDLNSRMQYTASSYADGLNDISRSVLLYRKKMTVQKGIFPLRGELESHSHDLIDTKIIIPFYRNLSSFISRMEFMSYTDIRYYIAFILFIITIYCAMAFIW
ncbi:MAG TPA: hypothetical protein VF857_02915, partial [Spirochaetota bacterium]